MRRTAPTLKRMKPRVTVIAVASLSLCIAFASGAFTAVKRGWGSPLVSVSVENETKLPVGPITLSYSSCGVTNELTAQRLAPGSDHIFNFIVCGEGGYEVSATLNDGRILSSGAYVESGYATRERIESTGIHSSYRSY